MTKESENTKKLNLPSTELKIRKVGDVTEIFDVFRKKYVKLNPEEWVRQNFIHYLVNHKNFPRGLISVEKTIRIDSLTRRPDAVVYGHNARPKMIIEFKSFQVDIGEDTLFQIAMYNKKLNVPYLVLSNGIRHFCARLDYEKAKLDFLDQIPEFGVIDV